MDLVKQCHYIVICFATMIPNKLYSIRVHSYSYLVPLHRLHDLRRRTLRIGDSDNFSVIRNEVSSGTDSVWCALNVLETRTSPEHFFGVLCSRTLSLSPPSMQMGIGLFGTPKKTFLICACFSCPFVLPPTFQMACRACKALTLSCAFSVLQHVVRPRIDSEMTCVVV